MTKEFHHVTVMLYETIDMLDVKPDGIYVDATLGGAGHSEYLLSKLSEKGHLYAFDQDQNAIDNAQKRLAPYIEKGMVTFIKDNFRNLRVRLHEAGVQEIDGICYDLGVSSPQLDQRERGFSYKKDAPLDMRMTTTELAEIIKSAKPAKELKKKGHPAKQIFQAIRIEVNDELGAADESIQQAMEMLDLGGRISVITFHSLEDRLTKQLFKEASTVEVPKGLPFIPDELKPKMELVSRKPILPSKAELEANNRSHSAKLRVARKIHK